MKIIETYEVKLPAYALSYIVNGDSSGIDDNDIKAIDNYMKYFYKQADSLDGHVIVSNEENNEEPYFTFSPDFGLACEVMDYKILIVK